MKPTKYETGLKPVCTDFAFTFWLWFVFGSLEPHRKNFPKNFKKYVDYFLVFGYNILSCLNCLHRGLDVLVSWIFFLDNGSRGVYNIYVAEANFCSNRSIRHLKVLIKSLM